MATRHSHTFLLVLGRHLIADPMLPPIDVSPEAIAARIDEAVEASLKTKIDIAGEVGVHVNTLSGWQSGRSTPNASELAKLAQAVDQSPLWLNFGVRVHEIDRLESPLRRQLKRMLETIQQALDARVSGQ